eukprot:s2039_g6.t1
MHVTLVALSRTESEVRSSPCTRRRHSWLVVTASAPSEYGQQRHHSDHCCFDHDAGGDDDKQDNNGSISNSNINNNNSSNNNSNNSNNSNHNSNHNNNSNKNKSTGEPPSPGTQFYMPLKMIHPMPDVLLCTNLAVFCWLLRRRGVSSSKMTMPALHVFGMAFLADVPNSWRSDMLADFYVWWSSPGPDLFAACQEVLSLQMWWQMGVKVPFVPLAGISSRVGAAYDPPQEEPSLLVLRSVFWHLPAGQVFAALLERFATSASPHVQLTWLGRYTHTISMRQVGPQESKQWRSFDSMGQHTCALDVPAEISQMKVRDVMGIGLPLMSPERAWLLGLEVDLSRSMAAVASDGYSASAAVGHGKVETAVVDQSAVVQMMKEWIESFVVGK